MAGHWYIFEESSKAFNGWMRVSKGFSNYETAKRWYDAMKAFHPSRKLCINSSF